MDAVKEDVHEVGVAEDAGDREMEMGDLLWQPLMRVAKRRFIKSLVSITL